MRAFVVPVKPNLELLFPKHRTSCNACFINIRVHKPTVTTMSIFKTVEINLSLINAEVVFYQHVSDISEVADVEFPTLLS